MTDADYLTTLIETAKLRGLTFSPDGEDVEILVPGCGSYIGVVVSHGYAFPPDTSYGPLHMRLSPETCHAMSLAFRIAAHLLDGTLKLNERKELVKTS